MRSLDEIIIMLGLAISDPSLPIEKLNTDLEPLADGNWIMNQTGLTKGIRLGRLKSWLYTIQIERDLTSISQIERVLSTLSWKNGDVDNWPQLKFPQ